jgi:hypothetical protein
MQSSKTIKAKVLSMVYAKKVQYLADMAPSGGRDVRWNDAIADM